MPNRDIVITVLGFIVLVLKIIEILLDEKALKETDNKLIKEKYRRREILSLLMMIMLGVMSVYAIVSQ